MKKLNVGCGSKWKELYPDYVGLDIIDYGQDFVGDILKKLQDSYNGLNRTMWDEVMANHFLEHFSQDELKIILPGIHKILVPHGKFRFVVPHKDREAGWVLSHKTFWTEETVRFLADYENAKIYGFGKWDLIELITNSKKNIHAVLQKA